MPELPDLESIRAVLVQRIVDVPILSAAVLRPLVVRNMLGGELNDGLAGRRFTDVRRRGKFLLLPLDDGNHLVVHPMLAGRLRYGPPLARDRTRDALAIRFADGAELRYNDARDMGKVYLVATLDQVPTFAELGPEATDPALTLELFRERLRPRRGEIKGALVDQTFVAGIGNAYADEILWRAQIYPFRRRTSLGQEEIATLYDAMRAVLAEAIATLAVRVGEDIDKEVRDFLVVHGKPGQPCPRCGGTISEVKQAGSATHFCRTCQPGLMVAKGRRL
jgi:formamidopyrimidine-DNA glycosylase